MRRVRATEAEKAFEEAWSRRDEVTILVEMAQKAASRGRLDEVEICLARLYLIAPERVEKLAEELQALADCVRSHPSYRDRRAG